MPIPESILRPILNEYAKTRDKNEQLRKDRQNEVYEKLPRVKQIDEFLTSTGLRLLSAYSAPNADSNAILSKITAENTKASEEKKSLMSEAGFAEDYMELHYECPDCKDTGFIGSKHCHCMSRALIAESYKSSNLSSLFKKNNFETFDLNRFSDAVPSGETESPRANVTKIKNAVMDFIWHFGINPGASFLFYGAPGTGKTFFLSCIAKEMIDHGHSVLYLSAYDLCDALAKRRFADRLSEEELGKILSRCEMIESCDLLLIDDLGTEFNTSLSQTDLLYCINNRMVSGKSVIISTNLTPNQLSKNYSERFASRVCGEYTLFRMFGKDLRLG